jgi:uncharacterized protein (DUF1499 family)
MSAESPGPASSPPRPSRMPGLGLGIAVVSLLLLPAGAFGYRSELVPLTTAFALLAGGTLAGAVAALVSAVGLVGSLGRGWRRGVTLGASGLAISVVTFGLPARQIVTARGLPAIHDITTDTADAPVFVAVLPLRADALNAAEYDPSLAAAQRGAYPELTPLVLEAPPSEVFARVLAAVESMGWTLVAADDGAGRIEATDTTFWFGFKDDVVVRLRPAGAGTRVDVRSVSRVGVGDVGANAARIRALLRRLTDGAT